MATDHFFAATILGGRLHHNGIPQWGPWEASRLHWRPEDHLDLRCRYCSAGGAYRTSGTAAVVTDAERLNDIVEKLRRWRYLSRYPDAGQDVAWLLEKLGERNARIAELEARLRQHEWIFLLP